MYSKQTLGGYAKAKMVFMVFICGIAGRCVDGRNGWEGFFTE